MLTGWRKILSTIIFIPQRYVLGIMGMFTLANAYTMRQCLNMAITQMVMSSSSEEGSEHYDPDSCPGELVVSNSTSGGSIISNDVFEWSEATQGLILSGFYYGYVITHIPGGLLGQRFGGKWVIGLGMLIASLGTMATPWATKLGGAPALFAIRVIQGLGEGPVTPCMILVMARWVPPNERSRIGSMIFGGAQLGNIFASYMSGWLLSNGEWPVVFYFFGGLGVVWFVFWTLLCYSTPHTHPFISDKERDYLNLNVEASALNSKLNPVPWKALLRSAPMWMLVAGAVGHDWGYFTLMTDLPKYMTDVLKYNIQDTGTLTALPYIAMALCTALFALTSDFCIKRKWHSITTGRKLYTTISSTLPAIAIMIASYAGCNREVAVVLFIVCMGFMGGFYSSVKINPVDIAPNFAATISAMTNGLAAVSGMITPYLVGLLTPDSTMVQWRSAFWSCFVVLIGTNLMYILWGSGQQQWWDDVEKYGYPKDWKHGPLPTRKDDVEKKVVDPKHDHLPVPAKS